MFKSKRVKKLSAFSLSLDMAFAERDEFGLIQLMKEFKLFSKGGSKRISNIISRKDIFKEFDVKIFDYQYVISTGNSSQRFRQTVFFVESFQLSLPHFWMQPEGLIHRIGNWFGFQDINFEDFPQFSKQYDLKGKDEERVRNEMNESVLHFFTLQKGWNLEGLNFYMILYRKSKLMPPDQIKTLFESGEKVFDLFRAKDH